MAVVRCTWHRAFRTSLPPYDAAQTAGVQVERSERTGHLLAAPRDVWAARAQGGLGVGGDERSRLVEHAVLEPHLPRQDAGARARSAILQPELHQALIDAHSRTRHR